MLITDVHSVSHLQIIEEASSKNNHRPKVRGLFQRADEANQNKRVYPKTILESQVKKLQPLIKERRLCGELDHPQNDTVKLTNASHLVTKLWMEGSEVMGEAEILNTPNGKVAQALISDGVKIGISSRGLGTLSEDHMTGQKTVNEDYNLVTFDLVADPSTRGAYPAISESRILEEARYERTLKEAVEERVFITMLKNNLSEAMSDDERIAQRADLRRRAKEANMTPAGRRRHYKDIGQGKFDNDAPPRGKRQEQEEDPGKRLRKKLGEARKGSAKGGDAGDWFEDPQSWEDKREKMFGKKKDDPYGGPDDPNRSEPEHMAAARRANYMGMQQDLMRGQKRSEENKAWQARQAAKKKKKKGGIRGVIKKIFRRGTNDSIEYVYTRSMERLAENKLRDRVRELAEDAREGYPGMAGGSDAAAAEARRRKLMGKRGVERERIQQSEGGRKVWGNKPEIKDPHGQGGLGKPKKETKYTS